MVGAGVVDFADDVNLVVVSIGGDMNGGRGIVRSADFSFCRAYLGLLPPRKSQAVAIRVGRL